MAFVHGKETDVVIDSTNLSQYTDSLSMDTSADTAETTAFGDDDKTFIAGLKDGSFSLSGHYDTTADAAFEGMYDGALVNITYGPSGSGSGSIAYTCAALITQYNTTSASADRVNWSASFQRSGALTRGTY